jgi:DNA-binding NtrC family response regulator
MTMKTLKNVLVCEDDPVQLKILTTLIDQAGYRPISARTPSEAVIAARRCGVDAILTDVQLEDGNAFDLVGDLRAIGFDAPVFMASAYGTEGMKARAHRAGVKHFFDKPFDLRQIRERVDEALKAPKSLDATILIVDVQGQVRADLEQTALAAGFEVHSAQNAVEAVDILLNTPSSLDLLLTDLHAPGSTGAALIRKALEIEPTLHVVMISGDADREEIRAGYAAGAASFIRKPVTPERLESFLKASLKAARAGQQRAQGRRERHERHAAAPVLRRMARWVRSVVHASSHGRKGRAILTVMMTVTALTVGVGMAQGFQAGYEAADRTKAMMDRVLQMAAPPERPNAAKLDAMLGRVQAAEHLSLTREANDVTRRYYEGHLQELRRQGRSKPASEMVPTFQMPDRAPSAR